MQKAAVAPETADRSTALDQELFGDRADARRDPGRRGWIWAVYAALYALSIPWYLPRDAAPAVRLGLPSWVVLSLAATTLVAIFTALVVRFHWSDEDGPERRSALPIDDCGLTIDDPSKSAIGNPQSSIPERPR